MSKPYGVMADLHCHSWSSFASVGADGVNTRLVQTLNEVDRCCKSILELGGNTVVIAGDVFHVRGSVAPSVFNPVRDCLVKWVSKGMVFHIIPGNHDLESKTSKELSSAVAMLRDANVFVHHAPNGEICMANGMWAFLPWIPKHADLLTAIGDLAAEIGHVSGYDLFIHAGIDGVLNGMPDHGLTAEKLGSFGFRRVFAGHYHHHADMGQGVYSVGAATHQTWSDVGTKAGWLIVDDENVRWMASHAPNFIEVTGEEGDDLPLIVDGHYVRARIGRATAAEVAQWREKLTEMGARGVLIQSVPVTTTAVRGGISASLNSLETAVADYAKEQGYPSQVGQLCTDILAEVQA